METKLARISQLSKENPDMVFTSLGHLINKEMLKSCHAQMDGTKAVGIDGITKEEYGRRLEENISALIERLKKKSYKPKPARLVEIPKDNGKMRPLSIYCYEDKLVQEALRRILEAVFEPIFYDEMMGFRPNRGCHKAIRKLNLMLERKPTSYVLDRQMELRYRPFVSWHLSSCCKNISESLDILEKNILEKPYYGMMIKYFKNLEKEPLDDIGATMAYESEKSRLDKKLEKQRETDLFSDL